MERFRFGPDLAFVPRGDLLDRVTVAPLTTPFEEGAPTQAAIFRFAPGGRIIRHAAGSFPQILAVLDGAGAVSGEDGVVTPITAGEAVYWREGEEHEATSPHGLTALIIEGESLEPFRGRQSAADPA